ncbi:MAG: reverse transcriptase domain-containing protein [Candidatus Nanoarchaeia archaeon]|nr:reverse transcriptase domain-containing protein [Candidatus Nanoarchaeia archaeon]
MYTYTNLYNKIYSYNNLVLAWKKARKGKTKKEYVIEFESNLIDNLLKLQEELKNETYNIIKLKRFVIRDPKTRVIHISNFRDRIVHHALCNLIEPIFKKMFIYDSCANQIGKGNLFAIKRFDLFKRKITKNNTKNAFCLKSDIKHYFQEVNNSILIKIIERKIADKQVINLIKLILKNGQEKEGMGMPLGNLTSQFFANIYLNELDYFIKHKLKIKYYIRYVDDFIILHNSKEQLIKWEEEINYFLNKELKLNLHPEKTKIVYLSRGIDFVGFRNFYHYRLLRKRNIKKIFYKIESYKNNEISKEKFLESYQGWQAYAKWANTYKLRKNILRRLNNIISIIYNSKE